MLCENPIAIKDPLEHMESCDRKTMRQLVKILELSRYPVSSELIKPVIHNAKKSIYLGTDYYTNYAPCRKCPSCLKQRSFEWFLRLEAERRCHKESCVVTLTYENKRALMKTDDGKWIITEIDMKGFLNYRDIQLFLKRLRLKEDVRYFVSGEYG